MNDWKEYKIGDIVEINKHNITRNYAYEKVLYLETGSITKGLIEKFDEYHISNAPVRAKRLVNSDDIVYSTVRPIQRHYGYFKCPPENLVVSTGFVVITPNSRLVNPLFLYYFLTLEDTVLYLDSVAEGSTTAYPSLTPDVIQGLSINLPPLKTQNTIAEILSSLDDKIDLLNRQNKTLENIFDILFNKYFLSVETNNLNKIRLNEIADFQNGLPCQKYPRKENELGLPVVKIKEMKNGITDTSDSVTENIPEDYIINDGDVLFSWSGSLEIAVWCGGKAVLNQHLFKVTSQKYPRWFFYAWIKHHLPKFKIIAESKTTTMGHIQKSDLTDSIVFVPENEEFVRIDKIMGNLFEKIHFNNISTKNLKNLLQLLISLYFTNR